MSVRYIPYRVKDDTIEPDVRRKQMFALWVQEQVDEAKEKAKTVCPNCFFVRSSDGSCNCEV